MSKFVQLLNQRVAYFDGGMGTAIHEMDLDLEKHYLGRENCTEALLFGAPWAIQQIHQVLHAALANGNQTASYIA